MRVDKIRWHYTTGDKWGMIFSSGVILPTDVRIDPGEKAVVWFTVSEDWEETANKSFSDPLTGGRILGTREMTNENCGGLIRIGVEPHTASYDWTEFKKRSGISSKSAKALYDNAISLGSRIGNWFVSFESVPSDKWISVEFWNGSGWEKLKEMQREVDGRREICTFFYEKDRPVRWELSTEKL